MKKIFIALFLALSLSISGCSEYVPPGYNAIKVTKQGIQPEIYGQGRVPLSLNPFAHERVVKLQTASELRSAPLEVIMTDRTVDKKGVVTQSLGLKMDFTINVRYRLSEEPSVVRSMLQDMKISSVDTIDTQLVYEKYGNMVIGRVGREVLGQYTPEEVLSSLANINKTLDNRVKESLNGTSPLVISSVSLGPVELPTMIQNRINKNKEAELSLIEKSIEQKKKMLDEANRKALATERKVRESIEANSLAAQNTIIQGSLSDKLLEFRRIQLRELEIEMMRESLKTGNNNTIFIPYGAQDTSAAQMRMYQK